MAEEKRYYWLKLKRDFFKRHDIQIVESMPNGKDYVLFYLKLLAESIDHEGMLRFNELIPYSEQMLSTITNTNIDIVRSAIVVLKQLDLIEVLDDQTIFVKDTKKMLGEGSSTSRVRQFRERKAQLKLVENVTVTLHETLHETQIEKEIEKEIEIKAKKSPKQTKITSCLSPNMDDAIKRFADHRKKLKSPMNENALSLLIKKLSTLSTSEEVQIAIIDQSILNGWKSVWELKDVASNGYEAKLDCSGGGMQM